MTLKTAVQHWTDENLSAHAELPDNKQLNQNGHKLSFCNCYFYDSIKQCVVTLAGNRDQGENGGGGLANKVFS